MGSQSSWERLCSSPLTSSLSPSVLVRTPCAVRHPPLVLPAQSLAPAPEVADRIFKSLCVALGERGRREGYTEVNQDWP